MSFFRDCIDDLLTPAVQATFGESISYFSVASGQTYTVPFISADSADGEQETTEGLTLGWHNQVFVIQKTVLPVMPQRLDKITWKNPKTGAEEVFQVLSDGATEATEPDDDYRTAWRIHCKQIPADPVPVNVYGNAAGDAYGNAAGDAYGGASS